MPDANQTEGGKPGGLMFLLAVIGVMLIMLVLKLSGLF
jgi:hypothetical protein